jgi:hypothetical protein
VAVDKRSTDGKRRIHSRVERHATYTLTSQEDGYYRIDCTLPSGRSYPLRTTPKLDSAKDVAQRHYWGVWLDAEPAPEPPKPAELPVEALPMMQ